MRHTTRKVRKRSKVKAQRPRGSADGLPKERQLELFKTVFDAVQKSNKEMMEQEAPFAGEEGEKRKEEADAGKI